MEGSTQICTNEITGPGLWDQAQEGGLDLASCHQNHRPSTILPAPVTMLFHPLPPHSTTTTTTDQPLSVDALGPPALYGATLVSPPTFQKHTVQHAFKSLLGKRTSPLGLVFWRRW